MDNILKPHHTLSHSCVCKATAPEANYYWGGGERSEENAILGV